MSYRRGWLAKVLGWGNNNAQQSNDKTLDRTNSFIQSIRDSISNARAQANEQGQSNNSQSAKAQRDSRKINVADYARKDRANSGSSKVNGGQEMMHRAQLGANDNLGRRAADDDWF